MPYSKSKEKLDLTYKFICAFIKKYKYPPSVREIRETVGFKSTASVQYYLDRLESEGFIRKSYCKNRTIEVVNENDLLDENSNSTNSQSVPYLGHVAAGKPLDAAVIIDRCYNLPNDYFNIKGNCFLLKVKGESMINAGILNEDMVLIKQQNTANQGDIIAAQIDNEEVTLKRFYLEKDVIRLHPENVNMKDIIINKDKNFRILGIMIGLMRNHI